MRIRATRTQKRAGSIHTSCHLVSTPPFSQNCMQERRRPTGLVRSGATPPLTFTPMFPVPFTFMFPLRPVTSPIIPLAAVAATAQSRFRPTPLVLCRAEIDAVWIDQRHDVRAEVAAELPRQWRVARDPLDEREHRDCARHLRRVGRLTMSTCRAPASSPNCKMCSSLPRGGVPMVVRLMWGSAARLSVQPWKNAVVFSGCAATAAVLRQRLCCDPERIRAGMQPQRRACRNDAADHDASRLRQPAAASAASCRGTLSGSVSRD
jgi:hypothetical protein